MVGYAMLYEEEVIRLKQAHAWVTLVLYWLSIKYRAILVRSMSCPQFLDYLFLKLIHLGKTFNKFIMLTPSQIRVSNQYKMFYLQPIKQLEIWLFLLLIFFIGLLIFLKITDQHEKIKRPEDCSFEKLKDFSCIKR